MQLSHKFENGNIFKTSWLQKAGLKLKKFKSSELRAQKILQVGLVVSHTIKGYYRVYYQCVTGFQATFWI